MVAQLAPSQIVIDGDFNDWANVPIALQDPADPQSTVDIGDVRVTADARFLFVQFATAQAVNVQTLAGTLSLLFDMDADAATGELDPRSARG